MPFERFMSIVLYDPEHGYYATTADRPTREGDYLSGPEMHPILGATLASQVEEIWQRLGRPGTFVLREDAAGSGALGLAILDHMVATGSGAVGAVRYLPIEANVRREAAIRARLTAAGHTARLADATDRDRPLTGLILANELLDALPVHRVTVRDGRFLELHVDWCDGWFTEVARPPSRPELATALARVGVDLAEGQVTEIGLDAAHWVRELGTRLERGVAILIDYGYPTPERYDPLLRPGGLLRTYRRHHAGEDPYRAVGRQDLTAHVDWTTLEMAGREGGLATLGRTTLAEALTGLGLGERLVELQSQAGMTAEAYAAARRAAVRLLDPRALGVFGVLVLGRAIEPDPPLRSLAFRLPGLRPPVGEPMPASDRAVEGADAGPAGIPG